MAIVNKCGDSELNANAWCLSTLFAEGEGDTLVLLQAEVWNSLKNHWATLSTAGPDKVFQRSANKNQVVFEFATPTLASGDTVQGVLFPENLIGANPTGLKFRGNNLIFNPTIGNAADADGIPYQKTAVTLPVGSSMTYDELVKVIQSKAWNALKINAEKNTINVYGGTRGLHPQADNVAEMVFSGNNDTKGKTSVILENVKTNNGIEYVKLNKSETDLTAISNLFDLIQSEACMLNGVEE